MGQRRREDSRKPVLLTTHLSSLLALAAILPLIITITCTELVSRPGLIAQQASSLSSDAHTRAQVISAYLLERVRDVDTISQLPFIHEYLGGDHTALQGASDELASADLHDGYYDSWSLFSADMRLLLSYPKPPPLHGKYFILPDLFERMQQLHQASISDVFYDSSSHEASIDFCMPVLAQNGQIQGFLRATLGLGYIAKILNGEADELGSYGMIVDQNGVRIACTNMDVSTETLPNHLFQAAAPLSPQLQRRIIDEDLYGNSTKPVTVFADPTLIRFQVNARLSSPFETVPSGQNASFEVVREYFSLMPWTYFALRPLTAITAIADQQLLYISAIAAFVLLLAVLAGVGVGRAITRPILQSVTSLLMSSQSLKQLASEEAVMASEQQWIVEASQKSLKSAQYYTQATNTVILRTHALCADLAENFPQLEAMPEMKQRIKDIDATVQYIGAAGAHQAKSNQSLATAIRVTTHVTDQLAFSTAQAVEAARQVEDVAKTLGRVIGRM